MDHDDAAYPGAPATANPMDRMSVIHRVGDLTFGPP
jgi:hypothetical protein